MFYSQVILARKGPLGKIWLAAHFDKKLTKQQIFATDITASVDSVLNPSVPLALRVSGHLMLGIVRIYSKKVRYLMTDCTEAMWKMKLAFRPGNVDIDPQAVTVAIDDLRHFGNIDFDDESRGFDHIAFSAHFVGDPGSSSAPPSPLSEASAMSKRRGRSQHSIVELGVSRLSDVEFARGEGSAYGRSPLVARSPSLMHAPFSGIREQSRMSISRLGDDELVAFDDKMFSVGGMEDYSLSFTAPEPAPAAPARAFEVEHELPPFEPADIPLTTAPVVSSVDETDVTAGAVGPAPRSKAPTKKKKRAHLDERVELSDRVVKQRIADTVPILRRRPGEPLPFQQETSLLAEPDQLPFEERIMQLPAYHSVCKELQWTIDVFTNMMPMPFPSRAPVTEPTARVERSPAMATPSVEMARGMETGSVQRGRVSLLPSGRESLKPGTLFEDEAFEGPELEMGAQVSYDLGDAPFESSFSAAPAVDELAQVMAKTGPGPSAPVVDAEPRMSDRTKNVLTMLQQHLQSSETVSFQALCAGASRKSAACFFLEVLQLKTWGEVDLRQLDAFGDMAITQA